MREEKLEALFDEYSAYHRDPINCLTHAIGFPLIFTGLFGLADQVGLGLVAFLLFCAMNLAVAWRLALVAAAVVLVLWWIGGALSTIWCCALLAAGVALPVAGHLYFERRWPETLDRLARFEAIGHLWFLDLAVGIVRRRN